ncbi:oxidoreductase [Bacillus canaveralius]|uniref:Oxidoreductase n=1 Tax=Bacillus canaveralius TaxID=1403243 RepID=A0A2N5GSJ8_9BACI|nr:4Fe-4S dicluster domain-containing protein [Bacillus canaveralius]PLR86747.1 oxidoreductase [Bacillus canaveralius]PLR92791.1 oxidoreductase [Bacillus canaveralius]RSK54655.1 4Fe-4S dicluster domain-containing protein [Bacillus canaveralius]
MNKQIGFVFNADICLGCKACEIACRNENHTDGSIRWRKVSKLSKEVHLSISCNHCNSPECFRVCPENAFAKRHDGIVLIDSNLCNGCGLCVSACPYCAPQFDYERQKVSKCQMCYPRQDKGLPPACVEACSTGALNIVNMERFTDQRAVQTIEGFADIRITQPSIVFYPAKPRKRYFIEH